MIHLDASECVKKNSDTFEQLHKIRSKNVLFAIFVRWLIIYGIMDIIGRLLAIFRSRYICLEIIVTVGTYLEKGKCVDGMSRSFGFAQCPLGIRLGSVQALFGFRSMSVQRPLKVRSELRGHCWDYGWNPFDKRTRFV